MWRVGWSDGCTSSLPFSLAKPVLRRFFMLARPCPVRTRGTNGGAGQVSVALSRLCVSVCRSLLFCCFPNLKMASRTMCTCHGTIHPLIPARTGALMCLNCGNIVCQAQGLGPCLFCGASCSNEQFAVTEELVTQQSASSASPAARQMNENLKRLVRRNPCEPLTEAEEKLLSYSGRQY